MEPLKLFAFIWAFMYSSNLEENSMPESGISGASTRAAIDRSGFIVATCVSGKRLSVFLQVVAQNLIRGSFESSLVSKSILSTVPYQLSLPNHFDETVLLS